MTNLENIRAKIISDAEQEAQAILQNSAAGLQVEIDRKLADARSEAAQIVERAKREAPGIADRIQTQAEREARDIRLSARQEVLDRVFELAKQRLVNLPSETYAKLLTAVLKKRKSDAGQEIIVPVGHSSGYAASGFQVIESTKLSNGFALQSNGVIENYDLPELADYMRDELESGVLELITERDV